MEQISFLDHVKGVGEACSEYQRPNPADYGLTRPSGNCLSRGTRFLIPVMVQSTKQSKKAHGRSYTNGFYARSRYPDSNMTVHRGRMYRTVSER